MEIAKNKYKIFRIHILATLSIALYLPYQIAQSLYGRFNLKPVVLLATHPGQYLALVIIVFLITAALLGMRREAKSGIVIYKLVYSRLDQKGVRGIFSALFLVLFVASISIQEMSPGAFHLLLSSTGQVIIKFAAPSIIAVQVYSLLSLIILSFWEHCADFQDARKRLSDILGQRLPPLLFGLATIKLAMYLTDRVLIGASPDIFTYIRLSDEMTHPFDTGIIEPIWIWVVKATMLLTNSKETALFILTSFIFLGSLVIIYRLVNDLFKNEILTAITGTILLFFDILFEVAVMGVRDNLFLFSVLGLIYSGFVDTKWLSTNRRRLLLTSLFFTLAIGTRITSLYPLTLILVVAYWKKEGMLSKIWVPIAICALVIGPYLYTSYQNFGDAMISSNIHARWIRNYEFLVLKQTGCAGCPSLEEYNPLLHQGEPISTFEYLFKMHPLSEVVRNTILGFILIYFSPSGYFIYLIGENHSLFFILYLVGLIAFFLKEDKFILLIPLMLTNFHLFTVPFYMPPRYLIINSVFFAILIAYGVKLILEKIVQQIPRFVRFEDGIGGHTTLPK